MNFLPKMNAHTKEKKKLPMTLTNMLKLQKINITNFY